jgi:hypothetical protein
MYVDIDPDDETTENRAIDTSQLLQRVREAQAAARRDDPSVFSLDAPPLRQLQAQDSFAIEMEPRRRWTFLGAAYAAVAMLLGSALAVAFGG